MTNLKIQIVLLYINKHYIITQLQVQSKISVIKINKSKQKKNKQTKKKTAKKHTHLKSMLKRKKNKIYINALDLSDLVLPNFFIFIFLT